LNVTRNISLAINFSSCSAEMTTCELQFFCSIGYVVAWADISRATQRDVLGLPGTLVTGDVPQPTVSSATFGCSPDIFSLSPRVRVVWPSFLFFFFFLIAFRAHVGYDENGRVPWPSLGFLA
jgi:hypothetical protein